MFVYVCTFSRSSHLYELSLLFLCSDIKGFISVQAVVTGLTTNYSVFLISCVRPCFSRSLIS